MGWSEGEVLGKGEESEEEEKEGGRLHHQFSHD